MNKHKQGKYKLTFQDYTGNNTEWYRDKSRAESRKNELENYRDKEDGSYPFTNVKIIFIPEEEIHLHRYNYN